MRSFRIPKELDEAANELIKNIGVNGVSRSTLDRIMWAITYATFENFRPQYAQKILNHFIHKDKAMMKPGKPQKLWLLQSFKTPPVLNEFEKPDITQALANTLIYKKKHQEETTE